MIEMGFKPKAFYRKLDALITQIGWGENIQKNLSVVLDELVMSFEDELQIQSGCVYELQWNVFRLVEGPVGEQSPDWPPSIPRDNEAISLLIQHKTYIFSDFPQAAWGSNSVGIVVGEEDQYLMLFQLQEGWQREALEFSMNTIRNVLNYNRNAGKLRADLEEAHHIQKSLLPREDPVFDGYDIAGRSIAAELVGGDLYDYHLFDENVLGLALGDASGHGLPAALVARDVVTGLRMGVEKEMKISSVMQKLNRVIHLSALTTRFVSLVYGELERNGTFVFVNAGHPPPLLFKAKKVKELRTGGTILGPVPDAVFKRGFAFLEPDDVLVMMSDGILERSDHDGELFGKDRVIDFVGSIKGDTASEIMDKLFNEVIEFGGGDKWRDDATIVVVKRID